MATGDREPSAIVLYVGHGTVTDPDGRFRLERVPPGSVASRAASADCIVVEEPGGGVRTLERLRETSVPTVLYDRTADPTVAARATQLGVTEYVTDGMDERPIDRIAAVAGVSGERPADCRAGAAMESLREALDDRSDPFSDTVEAILQAGCERFGASFGALAAVDGSSYSVVTAAGGVDLDRTVLSRTFCRRTVRLEGPCCLPDTGNALGNEEVTGPFDRLGSYLGTTVRAGGERYGTVWFGTETPRQRFSGSERGFLELLAGALGGEIEADRRRRALRATADGHERAIGSLAAAGRSFRAAETATEIAETAAETAAEIADVEISAVRLFEDGTPVARAGSPEDSRTGPTDRTSSLEPRPGELIIGDGSGTGGVGMRSATVTLGDRGLLSIGDGTGTITEAERSRLSLLAMQVESALRRVDRSGPPDSDIPEGKGRPEDKTAPDRTSGGDHDAVGSDRDRFQHLFDSLPDAAVDVEFLGGEPIVRRVNEAFEETFGHEESAIRDTPLNDAIVPADREAEAERLDQTSIQQGQDSAEVERLAADDRRTFLFRGFSYSHEGTERGFGIYTDMTDRLEQERRLRVLHRVLRHNLRNEMTAIIGYANILNEEVADETCREYAEHIYDRSMDVSKLGDQVRRIQQALDLDRQRVALDPEPLVNTLVDRFETDYPDVTISVSNDASGEVVGDELLKVAVENLIENAVQHHPGAATVHIGLSDDDEWLDITVEDDGPGIPERERAIVSGDREITQLDHSVGLGLWLSRWIVRGVGGRLVFGERTDGAAVTLRFRRADGQIGD
ncbi:ATP-binding protein [Natronomonas sp. LN261]|uniref:ATP-binding protein n=1 Tax=Natronomonas sp. LN261 TaxID=2750669 RepID=UPI0015EF69F0|nr:ATP-binding protein [Natronomonas sp. LN261]